MAQVKEPVEEEQEGVEVPPEQIGEGEEQALKGPREDEVDVDVEHGAEIQGGDAEYDDQAVEEGEGGEVGRSAVIQPPPSRREVPLIQQHQLQEEAEHVNIHREEGGQVDEDGGGRGALVVTARQQQRSPRKTAESTLPPSHHSLRRTSPHRTRAQAASSTSVIQTHVKKEYKLEGEELDLPDNADDFVCNDCDGIFTSRLELIEHRRACHRILPEEGLRGYSGGTLMCAHPLCGIALNDVVHLVAHLVGFHNQINFRGRRMTFPSIDAFHEWRESRDEDGKYPFVPSNAEMEVGPGISKQDFHCQHCDSWRNADHERLKMQNRTVIGCPANISVTFDHNKNSVELIGTLSHMGHYKKHSWGTMLAEDLTKKNAASNVRCNICGELCRSKTALATHRKIEHPQQIRAPALACGDPDCEFISDTMTNLVEHVADLHQKPEIHVQDARFESMQEFEAWKEREEQETQSFYTKVSGRQKAATTGPNAECYFRYYQCHLSGYVVRPSVRAKGMERPKMRNRSTKKMGRYCTAFMNIKINDIDGSVLMRGCLSHFGHECDVRRLPLTQALRMEITDLLQKGVSEDDVVSIIKDKCTPHDRGFYLQKYEVKNIVKKLIKESNGTLCYKYDDDAELMMPEEFDDDDDEREWSHQHHMAQQAHKRSSAGHMFATRYIRSAPQRPIGSYALQFLASNVTRKRRLVFRADALEHGESHNVDVGAVEEYYDGDLGTEDADQMEEYIQEAELEGASGSGLVLSGAGGGDVVAIRKMSRIPLLKDGSNFPPHNKEFESTLHSIQQKIRTMSDEIKRTKDAALAQQLLEEVRQLECRMSRLIPQNTHDQTFYRHTRVQDEDDIYAQLGDDAEYYTEEDMVEVGVDVVEEEEQQQQPGPSSSRARGGGVGHQPTTTYYHHTQHLVQRGGQQHGHRAMDIDVEHMENLTEDDPLTI